MRLFVKCKLMKLLHHLPDADQSKADLSLLCAGSLQRGRGGFLGVNVVD